MTPATMLSQGVQQLGLALPAGAYEKLLAFAALLEKWNRTYNLTAIRDPRRIMTHHLLDALAVLPHVPAGALADIGSGGGLPGIPLAIAQPARPVALADANAKKAAFLKQALIELALPNGSVHEGRVEQWRPNAGFAVVISRGFAELAAFATACRHLLAAGGVLLAMKGAYPRDELTRLPAGIAARDILALKVPFLDAERHLVTLEASAA